ncbi:MAG: sialidase family protein [Saprospiraceae bacterium]
MKKVFYISTVCILVMSCSKIMVAPEENNGDVVLMFDSIYEVIIHESSVNRPCEPSISICPDNTDHIVAGSVLNNVYISDDGGKTWISDKMKSAYGVYGDPVVRYVNGHRILYTHLSDPAGKPYNSIEFLDRIVVQASDDNGRTWNDGSSPLADMSKDHDKPWVATRPGTKLVLMSWTEFDKYASEESGDVSKILFSASADEGTTWSEAITISEFSGDCLDNDKTTEGAYPAIGVDGTYYVVWGYDSKLYLDISKDSGKIWLDNDKVVADQIGGWAIDIPGIGRCNGMPSIKCDHSANKYRGNLYISWSDQRNGLNDTDVWLISSSDKGLTWTTPVRVNTDGTGKHQFFSAMDVDQSTGYIYFVFYDRRDYSDNRTDVYLAYSLDGGKTFENKKISQYSFLPEPSLFFGDYNDISASNGKIRPIWTHQDKTKLSVRTAIIDIKK